MSTESGYSQIHPIDGIGMAGEWAVAGKKIDGDPEPAQQPFGWSFMRYKQEIEKLEEGEEITCRIMDSRFGASPTPTKSGVTTLIDEMGDIGLHFEPSVGARIDEGVSMINDLLDYDQDREVGIDNSPRLFIHEDCKNLRFALATWTGNDGKHGATKDFIDTLRYFCLAEPYLSG